MKVRIERKNRYWYKDIEVIFADELSRYIKRLNKDTLITLGETKDLFISKITDRSYDVLFLTDSSRCFYTLVNLPSKAGILSLDEGDIKQILDVDFGIALQAAVYFFEHKKMDPSLVWAVNYSYPDESPCRRRA